MPRRKQIDGQLSLDFSAIPEEKVVQKKIDRKTTVPIQECTKTEKKDYKECYNKAVALTKERGTAHLGMFMRVFHISAMESLKIIEDMEHSGLIEHSGRIRNPGSGGQKKGLGYDKTRRN